jgi:non-specific protein-tyrosine kinase
MALVNKQTGSVGDLAENNVESQPKLKAASPKETGDPTSKAATSVSAPGPQIKPDPNFPLVLDHNHSMAAESFSILRSRILGVHKKLGTRSILITSAEAGDGKTLIATNIALSLGQLGSKRILLVDGDLRYATVTRILNLKHLPGMGEFLQGRRPFSAVVHPTGFPALSVAPAGLISKKILPEILQGPRWPEFLQQAKEEFDLIIVDSLPVSAPVADLELLTAPCDAFLFVVYMRRTQRQALERANKRLDQKKFLGVIINNADEIYDYDYSYLNPKG